MEQISERTLSSCLSEGSNQWTLSHLADTEILRFGLEKTLIEPSSVRSDVTRRGAAGRNGVSERGFGWQLEKPAQRVGGWLLFLHFTRSDSSSPLYTLDFTHLIYHVPLR